MFMMILMIIFDENNNTNYDDMNQWWCLMRKKMMIIFNSDMKTDVWWLWTNDEDEDTNALEILLYIICFLFNNKM